MIAQKVDEENECSIVSAKFKSRGHSPYDYKEHEDQIIEKMKNPQKIILLKEPKKLLCKEKQRIDCKEK